MSKMAGRSVHTLLLYALLALLTACGGDRSSSYAAPSRPTEKPRLPELNELAQGAGISLKGSSSESLELLNALPVSTSPGGSASAQIGSLSLNPALNAGFAWAVYELYDFQSDGSVLPELVSAATDGNCYLGISNFSAQVWNHFAFSGAPLTLGSASEYYNDRGTMYVVLIATAAALTVDSLTVQVSGPLENAGYNEHENNDKAADANLLPAFPFSGYLGHAGAGGYDGDASDYFKFSAQEGDLLSLDVVYDPQAANLSLTLYRPNSSSVLVEESSGNPGLRHLGIGLQAGDYVLRLRSISGAGDYSITGAMTPSGYSELEDNDIVGQANVLDGVLNVDGAVGASSYDGDDKDYFSFTAAEGETATLTLSYSAANANLSLSLLDAGNNVIKKDTAGNSGMRSFSWGLQAGTTYALVEAESGAAAYHLDITIVDPDYDEQEDNDGFATAQPLAGDSAAGFSGSVGEFGYDGDSLDYFSFNCDPGDIASADLSYDNSGGNLSLTLYNEDHSQAQKDSAGNPGARSVSWGLHGGTCFVLVKAETGGSAYSLSLSKVSPGYDEVEHNDATASSNLLSSFPVSGWQGSLGSGLYDGDGTDYCTFTAADKELFSFSLSYDEAAANLGFVLLNGANQTIYSATSGNPGSRSFDWGLKAGNYYLRLISASGASDYSLDVSKTAQSLGETEDNDSRAGAEAATLPFAYDCHCGDFGYDGDNDDYFFVNQGTDAQISADIAYDQLSGQLGLYLLDADGSVIDSDSAGNPGVRSVSAPVTAGTYYIRVQCSSGGTDYTVNATN